MGISNDSGNVGKTLAILARRGFAEARVGPNEQLKWWRISDLGAVVAGLGTYQSMAA